MKIEIKVSGQRGAGKTYLLNALEEKVAEIMGKREYHLTLLEGRGFHQVSPSMGETLNALFGKDA